MTQESERTPALAANDQPLAAYDARNQPASRRVCVLVLGMHRSGSSALTRMLNLLGCALPNTLMPGNPTNPTGHWESDAIAQFNDDILAQAGTRWDDWQPVNPRLSETLIWPQLVQRGREVLREEFADAPLFVMKDPRICKLTGFWLEVLAAEGVEPVFVLPIRNPLEVARSLTIRNGFDEYLGLLIWLRHVLSAEAATRGMPRVFTEYASLLTNWEALAERVGNGLGVVWPRKSALSASEIAEYLAPDLRHHVSNPGDLGSNPAISSWISTAYELLLDWALQGENPADFPVLDQISNAFEAAGTAFARPMLHAVLADGRAAHLQAERAAIAEQHDQARGRLGEVEAELANTLDQRNALAEGNEQLSWRLGAVEVELATTVSQRDTLNAERDRLSGDSDALAAERDDLVTQRDELTTERDNLARERDGLVDERALLAGEKDELAEKLAELAAGHADLRDQYDTAAARLAVQEDALAVANAKIEALQHRGATTESTLRQREEEIAQLGTELAETRAEAAEHAGSAAAASADADRLQQRLAEARIAAEQERQRLAAAIADAQNDARRLQNQLSASAADQAAMANRLANELAEARASTRAAEDRARRAEAEKATEQRRLTERAAELTAAKIALSAAETDANAERARADRYSAQTATLAWHRLNDRMARGRTTQLLELAQRKLAGQAARQIAVARNPYGRLLRRLGLGYSRAARMGANADLIEAFLDDLPWPLVGVHPEGRRTRVLAYVAGASDSLPDFPFVSNSEYYQLHPDVASSNMPALAHFIVFGQAEARAPLALFDSAWYLARYPEARHVAPSAIVHYLKWGMAKGFDPHPLFSTRGYQARYTDVGKSGRNPLLHWIENPRCTAHPLFDADYYLNSYGDVADAGCNPFNHYLAMGWRERRNPHPLFDTEYYLAGLPDLRAQGICPLVHYAETGWRDRRRCSIGFDPQFYQAAYPDLGPEVDLLLHYIEHGRGEGRIPLPPASPIAPPPAAAPVARTPVATGSVVTTPAAVRTVPVAGTAAVATTVRPRVALMIDAFYPSPDRDSGSLDQIAFVQIFQRLGYEVHFLALFDFYQDHQEDTPRYRQALRDEAVVTVTSADYPFIESYYFDESDRIAVVFGSRVHFGGGQLATLRELCPGARTIFNTVDLHFIREQREGELKNDPAILQQAEQTREIECSICAGADATIVVSTTEKNTLSQLLPQANIAVVPLLRGFTERPKTGYSGRRAIAFIGGFMHQPNVDAVEHFLGAIWPEIRRRRPDIGFRVIGADMPATMRERQVEGVEFVGYVADLDAELATLRMTIAPLRFGAGAKGKLVSSLGSGVPCVVSKVAAEGMGLVDGETVLVAELGSSFADQVIRLYDDQALWQRLSDNGLAFVRRAHSLDAGFALMRDILTGIGVELPQNG